MKSGSRETPDPGNRGYFARLADASRAAGALQISSAFSSPICLQNKVIGILEFFSKRKRSTETELLNLMMTIGAALGQFIQRKVIENELRDSVRGYRRFSRSLL